MRKWVRSCASRQGSETASWGAWGDAPREAAGPARVRLDCVSAFGSLAADAPSVKPQNAQVGMANGMPTVFTFRDILDAQAAAALLEAEGIECVLANEYLIGVAWTYSTAVGGVQLQVAPDRADEARALLEADESASLADVESALPAHRGDDACPRCGSDQVTLVRWSRYAVAAMLVVPLPLFIWRNRVKCGSCGNEWKPPGV